MRRSGGIIGLVGLALTPVLIWLALPGRFSFWPLLMVGLVPFFHHVSRARNLKNAFWLGLVSGILLFVLLIYWIVPVLVEFGGLPWILAVPALLLLVAYMSLYPAVVACLLYLTTRDERFWLFLVGVPSAWVGLDWLRAWLFSGFPWMDLGYGFWSVPRFLQAADLFGHYGYTFLVVLVNCSVFAFYSRRFSLTQRYSGALMALVLIVLVGGYSLLRWPQIEELRGQAPAPAIAIVQGNIEQGQKWSADQRRKTVEGYVKTSDSLVGTTSPKLIIWPETALPFYPRNNELLRPLADLVQKNGLYLLTGAPWYEVEQGKGQRLISYFNAALLLSPEGRFVDAYFKSHLVPYGEYVPLKRYLPFLSPIVEAAGNFSPGRVEQPLVVGEIKAGVLICFESIFESISRAWADSGANVLVNLTNDAWYGKSSAPHQSWAMTVYRAVETRRSLVRAANTGISGVIDPLGRVQIESELFVPWSGTVAVPLMSTRTFFVQWGYLFAPLCGLLALACGLLALKRPQRRSGLVL